MRRLELVPYDPSWPAAFASESARLTSVVGAHVLRVEHVGSTSVPQLMGKPVIDIALAVASLDVANACIEPLQSLGYVYRGLHGDDPARRYYELTRGGRRVAQIHLYIMPAQGWDEMLRFRDALRESPTLAAAYAAEKRRVAEAVAWDKSEYSVAKGPFIRGVLDGCKTA